MNDASGSVKWRTSCLSFEQRDHGKLCSLCFCAVVLFLFIHYILTSEFGIFWGTIFVQFGEFFSIFYFFSRAHWHLRLTPELLWASLCGSGPPASCSIDIHEFWFDWRRIKKKGHIHTVLCKHWREKQRIHTETTIPLSHKHTQTLFSLVLVKNCCWWAP